MAILTKEHKPQQNKELNGFLITHFSYQNTIFFIVSFFATKSRTRDYQHN
jgi:hypothetical protein